MPDLSKMDAIRRAYLDPIRTVILIDDEFPAYDRFAIGAELPAGTPPAAPPVGLDAETAIVKNIDPETAAADPVPGPGDGEAAGPPARDYDRAKSLWVACRELGYLCDVDDGSGIGTEIPRHIDKSDLVILDFHLQGQDPTIALRLLQHLARTEHASLVVVYTRDGNLDEVRRRVAAHLRGSRRLDSFLAPADLELWEKMEDWTPSPTGATLDALLRGDRKAACLDAELRGQLEQRGVERARCSAMIEAAIESFLAEVYRATPIAAEHLPAVGMSEAGKPSKWVRADNLFVAFVQKTAENALQGGQVFGALEEALKDWTPAYLPTVLSFARGVVSRGGFRSEGKTLSDPLLQAGWLYHSVTGAEDERPDRLRGLFERLLSSHVGALLDEIAEFGRAAFPDYDGAGDALDWAKGLVPGLAGKDDWNIFHSLNQFLATESAGSFVQTGTVFEAETKEAGNSVAWICVTPACDLVPREPKAGTWEHSLHPIRPMIVIRGQIGESGGGVLEHAERFHHVYLSDKGRQTALKVVDPSDPNARLEMFLLDDMGRIRDNKTFAATRLSKSADGVLHTSTVTLKVTGQLRGLYASRILQLAGYHLARIGVDFVDMPRQEPKKKK